MAEAMIRCELKMPDGAIHTHATLTTICAYVHADRPRPPYSSPMVAPKRPELLHLLDDRVRILVGLVELARDRPQLLLDPVLDRVDELLLVAVHASRVHQ